MRSGLGRLIKGVGYVVIAVCDIWVFLAGLRIASNLGGFWGVVVGIVLWPLTLWAMPLYAAFALGNWLPFLVSYGGGMAGAALVVLGTAVKGDTFGWR